MKNYKITIAYDGTRYRGWQIQKSTEDTIQGKITRVLERLTGEEVEVIGSGRTDAGVHAKGQVANFHIKEGFSGEEILEYLNQYLPEDIAVYEIEEVPDRFHSRFNATTKTYAYRIHTDKVPNVFERKFLYTYLEPLSIEKMKEVAKVLEGTHDFASFCSNKKMKKSTVRTIYSIEFDKKDSELVIRFTGNGFLQNMIRILVGTLIEAGTNRKTVEEVAALLEKKERKEAGYTVPPQGLMLERVTYAEVDGN